MASEGFTFWVSDARGNEKCFGNLEDLREYTALYTDETQHLVFSFCKNAVSMKLPLYSFSTFEELRQAHVLHTHVLMRTPAVLLPRAAHAVSQRGAKRKLDYEDVVV
jgi:hypothetical protein